MKHMFKSLAAGVAAVTLVSATAVPAEAQPRHRNHGHNSSGAAALGGFIAGVIVDRAIQNNRRNDGYNDGYYPRTGSGTGQCGYWENVPVQDRYGHTHTEKVCLSQQYNNSGPVNGQQGGQTCVSGNYTFTVAPGARCPTDQDRRYRPW